jgi:hypothetical protein
MKIDKTCLLGLILWLCAIGTNASTPDYWRSDSIKVMRLFKEAARLRTDTNYMLFFARKLAGLPYVGKTLEHNEQERLVVNIDSSIAPLSSRRCCTEAVYGPAHANIRQILRQTFGSYGIAAARYL